MSKYTYGIFGTGRMGQAAAFYLATQPDTKKIILFDVNDHVFATAAILREFKNVNCEIVSHLGSVSSLDRYENISTVVAACGYSRHVELTKKCIERKIHMVDLGGNRDVVAQQHGLHNEAKHAGVSIVPDQGLAPGAINIMAMHAFRQLEADGCTDIDIMMRVGGLPANPAIDNPMKYELTWSADGLINEYVIPAEAIVDGKKVSVKSLTQLEKLDIPNQYVGSEFEAFVTGGGSSNLPSILERRVRNLNYKTIRYKGHCEIMRALELLGLFDEGRSTMTTLFEKNLKCKDWDDIIIARAGARGKNSDGRTINVGNDMICVQDPETDFSAMAQTTGFSAGIVASMLAGDTINARGVLYGEEHVDGLQFIERLKSTGISVGSLGSLGKL